MDKSDLRTLKILEQIDEDEQTSQRRLASHLGISLGLANAFVKRLAGKGYFKIVSTPANRFKYMLTPQGFSEKARLSYNYIVYSYQFYKEARQNLRKVFLSLEKEGVKTVLFCGVSDFAEIAYLSLQETGIELAAIADNDKNKNKFFGYLVLSVPEIKHIHFDKIIITDLEKRETTVQTVIESGFSREMLVLP